MIVARQQAVGRLEAAHGGSISIHSALARLADDLHVQIRESARLLELRETQLADCTRAMREVATELLYIVGGEDGVESVDPGEARELAAKLSAVRGGNRCDACGKSLPWDEVADERLWASSGVCNQDCAVRAGKAAQ